MNKRSRVSFKSVVIDALVTSHIYQAEHETDPRKALHDLLCWETQVALDPAVSQAAQQLVATAAEAVQARDAARDEVRDLTVELKRARAERDLVREELAQEEPPENHVPYWMQVAIYPLIRDTTCYYCIFLRGCIAGGVVAAAVAALIWRFPWAA